MDVDRFLRRALGHCEGYSAAPSIWFSSIKDASNLPLLGAYERCRERDHAVVRRSVLSGEDRLNRVTIR